MGVDHPADLINAYRSDRLIYRAIEDNEADKKFVFENNNDPVLQYMSSPRILKPESNAGFEQFLSFGKDCLVNAIACLPPLLKEGEEARMAPTDVKTADLARATPIGFVCITGSKTMAHHRGGMLGISILSPFTAKGYGGEMINWALDWSFRRANLHRVELGTWSCNHNAIKLYRSLGFVEEGRAREALILDRKFVDIINFSMLEGEWEKLRGISN
jgi:RimJ/RimL family protein N-acetyltransferase